MRRKAKGLTHDVVRTWMAAGCHKCVIEDYSSMSLVMGSFFDPLCPCLFSRKKEDMYYGKTSRQILTALVGSDGVSTGVSYGKCSGG